jgi:hypothetical protein
MTRIGFTGRHQERTAAKLAEPAKYNPTKTINQTLTPGTKPRTHRFITFSSEV